MNTKQKQFVAEFVVDHNQTKAAVRAGYAESRGKQTGYRLIQNPEVVQAIEKLDAERRERVGVSADWVVEQWVTVYEKSLAGLPRTDRDGKPVRVEVDGESIMVYDWSPAGANKALEQLAKHLGMQVERKEVSISGGVVYQLSLDELTPYSGDLTDVGG